MTELRFFVAGIPATQGSMKCVGVDKRTGRHLVIPDNPPKLKQWRGAVHARACEAALALGWYRLDCAEVRMIFRLDRPQNHYRTGRFSTLLRDDAPMYPTVKPDGDKLVRAIFDALTAAHVITDDAVIVTHTAAKRYCQPDQPPGVNIVLSAPVAAQQPLIEVSR